MIIIIVRVTCPTCFWYVIWYGRVWCTTRKFWRANAPNKDLNKLIAEQTNLYSVQKDGKSIATTKDESNNLSVFQCLCRLMIFHCKWCTELVKLGTSPDPPIGDVMPINRYTKRRHYLHFSDNSKIDDAENKKNKLYKI